MAVNPLFTDVYAKQNAVSVNMRLKVFPYRIEFVSYSAIFAPHMPEIHLLVSYCSAANLIKAFRNRDAWIPKYVQHL